MTNLIDYLESFNSKERYHLIRNILRDNDFFLSSKFLQQLGDCIHEQIPHNYYWAFDYHIDWIYASLFLANQDNSQRIFSNKDQIIQGNIEDADLLIVFEKEDNIHLVLIEAKLTGSWNNNQMLSKAKRYKRIFGDFGDRWTSVTPHFVITSPNRPQHLDLKLWARWMKPDTGDNFLWLKLNKPQNLLKVIRCDESGKKSSQGEFWTYTNR